MASSNLPVCEAIGARDGDGAHRTRYVSPIARREARDSEFLSQTVPTIHISADLLDSIARHAVRVQPEEGCGILIGRREGNDVRILRAVESDNIADGDRTREYQIDWGVLLHTTRTTRDDASRIVGFYHSHPAGPSTPSARDRRDAWRGYSYLIVITKEGLLDMAAGWWAPTDGAPFERQRVIIIP